MGGCSEGCKEEFKCSNFKLSHEKPSLFVTSQWERVCVCSIPFYLVFRLLAVLFCIVVIILSGAVKYDWYNEESDRIKWFIYLTNWSFFLLTVDSIIQFVLVAYATCKRKTTGAIDLVFKEMAWYLKMEWVITNMATCAGILTTILFWVFISNPDTDTHYVDFNTHATNTIYIFVNLFLTAMPVRIYHLFHAWIFAITYLAFSAIYQTSGGTNSLGYSSIYSILDWNDPGTTTLYAFMFGIVTPIAIWLIIYGLYRLRLVIFNALLVSKGISHDPFIEEGREMKEGTSTINGGTIASAGQDNYSYKAW